ncbi:MAG: hypothetical protein ACKV19_18050 [Verrucomicrobiales bacterium]
MIWPDLHLATEHLRSANKLRLHGTIPGLVYLLESTSDLTQRAGREGIRAKATTLDLDIPAEVTPQQFYRARR